MPDGFTVASQILNATERLGVLLAHRPGFIAPTIAARMYATIDAFHPGRIALHVISGGDDADQARDGDFSDKPTRYRRADEFLDIVEREWSSSERFDYEGEFYRVKGALSSVRPAGGHLPIYFGGASEHAVRVGGRHADVYAFWGQPLDGIRQRIAEVQAAAQAAGRTVDRFSVSLRPIAADTEEAAWERANEILERTQERAAAYVAAEHRRVRGVAAAAPLRRAEGPARQAPVDRAVQGDRRGGQLHRPRRQLRAGRRVAARLRRRRREHAADPRLRPGRRRRRLRHPRPARAREGRRRRPRLPRRRRLSSIAIQNQSQLSPGLMIIRNQMLTLRKLAPKLHITGQISRH